MEDYPKVSIITSARNEEPHIEKTIRSMIENTEYPNYEIIAVNDNSNDSTESILANLNNLPNVKTLKSHGLGTARARNFAFRFAKGDLLLFCDAHLTMTPGWLEKIIDISKNVEFDVLSIPMKPDPKGFLGSNVTGYGQYLDSKLRTLWYTDQPNGYMEVAISPGGCALYKRDVFKKIGGYDKGFNVWGYEDVEISIKAWLMGYITKVAYDMFVYHYFRRGTPYSVNYVDYYYNYIRTAYLHFSMERVEKFKVSLFGASGYAPGKSHKVVDEIMQKIEASDTMMQRHIYFSKRKHDEEWYFKKFGIDF